MKTLLPTFLEQAAAVAAAAGRGLMRTTDEDADVSR